MMAGVILRAAEHEFGERSGVSPMALDLRLSLIQCRLLLRKSSVTFAERKTTLTKSSAIGREPSGISFLYRQADACRSPILSLMTA